MKARIAPVQPPYDTETESMLRKWMPPGSGIEPLQLFRVLARHPDLMSRMRVVGAGLLGNGLIPARDRELMILRTSALAGAEYEWGVHASAFGASVGISPADAAAVAAGSFDRFSARDTLVLRLADSLHETSSVDDPLWKELESEFSPEQLLELLILAGWYHVIAYVINAAGVEPEEWAQRLGDQAAA